MSRSGYSDDCDNVELWRGAVDRAILGGRGQRFMRKLRDALDALPTKRLIAGALVDERGEVCALGAVDPAANVDPDDRYAVAAHFDIAPALAAEIAYMNDEWAAMWRNETPEQRWARMREWVDKQIGPEEFLEPAEREKTR